MKRFMSSMLAFTMAAALLSGCGGNSSTETAGGEAAAVETGSTVLRITQSSGGVIDPGTGEDCTSSIAYANLYDSLVYPDMDNKPVAQLADSWETSEDGLTWTFKLKEGIKFHDGTDLLASDET